MNLLVAVINEFTESSSAFQLKKWSRLATEHDFHFVGFIGDVALANLQAAGTVLTNVTLIKMSDHPQDLENLFNSRTFSLQSVFDQLVERHKPEKITCNMDFLLFKYLEKYDCQKQIFVRQFFNKIYDVSKAHPVLSQDAAELEKLRVASLEEERCLRLADKVIVNNNLTAANLSALLGLDSLSIPQYRDPAPFAVYTPPDFSLKKYYNVGRLDRIKAVSSLRPSKYELILIGNNLLSNYAVNLPNTTFVHAFVGIEQWIGLVRDIPISVNPCIYETNGFAVQESLMMGKITVVQKNSGGNLLHIKDGDNGLVVDFETDDYESVLESLTLQDMQRLSVNARDTISPDLYQRSVDDYVLEII